MKTVANMAVRTVARLNQGLVFALLQAQTRTRPPPRQDRGVIMVEFVLLTAAIAIPVAIAFVSLGIPLLRYFRYAQMALVGPLP
jgi:hypothetical protein